MLREQLINQEMLVLVLPALISLVEHCSEEDYKSLVQPEVKRVLTMSRPVQVRGDRAVHKCVIHVQCIPFSSNPKGKPK